MTCGLCERREADRRFIVTGATGPIDYPAAASIATRTPRLREALDAGTITYRSSTHVAAGRQ